jgi:hypothetical protein
MFETIILLVLAGLALIFRWFTSRTTRDTDERRPALPNDRPRRPAESEQERVRRFLEALGMPEGSAPPPPLRPRPAPPRRLVTPTTAETPRPKRRRLLQPLPPLVTVPRDKTPPGPPTASEPPPLPILTPAVPLPGAPVAGQTSRRPMAVARQPARWASRPPKEISPLIALLRDRRGLQQAIILREILGPPRAFAPLAADRSFPGQV